MELDKLLELEDRIGVKFNNHDMLLQALTHRSYLNERPSWHLDHNERLEFLGDAVLELVVTDYLYKNYPNPEGELTNWRAAIVNAVILSKICGKFDLNDYILLSRGEAKDTGRARHTILANTFEAVVGALYLDQGLTAVKDFVEKHVMLHTEEIVTKGAWRDAKSAFQEFAQEKYGMTPAYETVRAEGPDHDRHFVVSVSVGDVAIAEGEGKSKQEAEQAAAERALTEERKK